MRRLQIMLYIVLFSFQFTVAQTMTTKNGLSTLIFDTKYAIFSVYLPDDLQNGDKISGTFSVLNSGLTDEQMEKSLMEVRKYKFNFSNPENQTSVLQKMINIQPNQLVNLLPLKITKSLILSLTESTGKIYKKEIKPSADPSVTVDDCLSPEHFLLGEPLRITGTFDGNASNTRVSIGSTYFPVLAESPRQCIVDIPQNLPIKDNMEIKVVEDFKPKCTQSVLPVKMTVGYEKIKVKKGETANVYIVITGLEGMENPSRLTVENNSQGVVSLKNGNKQEIEISPSLFNGGTAYKMNFTVQGITAGDFSLDFKLDIPEDFPSVIER